MYVLVLDTSIWAMAHMPPIVKVIMMKSYMELLNRFKFFCGSRRFKVNSKLNTVLALKLPIELLSRNAHILSLGNLSKDFF